MSPKVYVIGEGILSAIGENSDLVYNNLINYSSGLRSIQNFKTDFNKTPLAGEVKFSNLELVKKLELDIDFPYSRTMLLGLFAAQQAIRNAGINDEHLKNTGFISANTVGGMDQTENLFFDYIKNPSKLNTESIGQHDCGASTEFIAKKLGIGGFRTSISTACSSSANAIMLAARMIASGKADIMIAGGTDALCCFTLNGFNSLMLLSNEVCKPFDKNRTGLNLGEGSAFIVLCSEKMAKHYSVIAQISGWGNANDAYHQTASSPDGRGASIAMMKALETSGIKPSQVDYINAHGTATPNNDLAEIQAIKSVFKNVPPFSSTKPFTGHTLGAAGAIEALISILALSKQTIFPSLNFQTAMDDTNLIPAIEVKNTPLNYVLSNSFGFGGNCTSLLFKKTIE